MRHESEPGLLAGDLDPGPLVVPCVLEPAPGREVDNRADSGEFCLERFVGSVAEEPAVAAEPVSIFGMTPDTDVNDSAGPHDASQFGKCDSEVVLGQVHKRAHALRSVEGVVLEGQMSGIGLHGTQSER